MFNASYYADTEVVSGEFVFAHSGSAQSEPAGVDLSAVVLGTLQLEEPHVLFRILGPFNITLEKTYERMKTPHWPPD